MKRAPGFTLVEMLIALAIFSLLVATLMMGFRQGVLLWEKSGRQQALWLRMEFAYRLLDSAMSQANRADQIVAEGKFAPWFKGERHRLKMVTAAPLLDVPGHTRPIELEIQRVHDTQWQLRYREGERYDNSGAAIRWPQQWAVLLDALQSADFSYEAPANPIPPHIRTAYLTPKTRARYRNRAQWLPRFDSATLMQYPEQMALHFIDGAGKEHRWLFTFPQGSDPWSMRLYQVGVH